MLPHHNHSSEPLPPGVVWRAGGAAWGFAVWSAAFLRATIEALGWESAKPTYVAGAFCGTVVALSLAAKVQGPDKGSGARAALWSFFAASAISVTLWCVTR